MGNKNICKTDLEDKNMSNLNKAVGTQVNEIDSAILDECLSKNSAKVNLKEKVELSISLKDLPNLDKDSKTDAYCVIFQLNGREKKLLGMTEVIENNLNPDFI